MTTRDSLLLKEGKILPLMEEFYTLQGEGVHTGIPAYFLRIGGCDVGCKWCDVKESWDATIHPATSTDKIVADAAKHSDTVVVTGGEPLTWKHGLSHLTTEKKRTSDSFGNLWKLSFDRNMGLDMFVT